jgi:hypothetical protein
MALKNGTDILLLINDNPISALTSNDFNIDVDIKSITSKDDYGWEAKKPTKKSFAATASGFIKGVGNNLLKASEDLSNVYWLKTGTLSVTTNSDTDFNGKQTLDTVTFGTGTIYQVLTVLSSTAYTFSAYVKGTGTISLSVTDGVTTQTQSITLSSTLTRYSVTITTDAASTTLTCNVNKVGATSAKVGNLMVNSSSTVLDYTRSGLTFEELYDLTVAGTLFTMVISDQVSGNKQWSGSGYLKALKQGASVEDIATYSCSIEGTATMAKQTI